MSVSQRSLILLFYASTALPVLLRSPVSIYKAQLCCQNIRAASAASICKVSSWAIASSRASVSHDLRLPLAVSFHSFFIALLGIKGPSLVGQY